MGLLRQIGEVRSWSAMLCCDACDLFVLRCERNYASVDASYESGEASGCAEADPFCG